MKDEYGRVIVGVWEGTWKSDGDEMWVVKTSNNKWAWCAKKWGHYSDTTWFCSASEDYVTEMVNLGNQVYVPQDPLPKPEKSTVVKLMSFRRF